MIFLKGIITGLILSLPLGPVGIYCMEKAMIEGEKKSVCISVGDGYCRHNLWYNIISIHK